MNANFLYSVKRKNECQILILIELLNLFGIHHCVVFVAAYSEEINTLVWNAHWVWVTTANMQKT